MKSFKQVLRTKIKLKNKKKASQLKRTRKILPLRPDYSKQEIGS